MSVPYSSSYSSLAISHGQLARLAHRHEAGAEPVGDRRREDEARGPRCRPPGRSRRRRSGRRWRRSRTGTRSRRPSSGVMSLKMTPGFGKSGMSRTCSSSHVTSTVIFRGYSRGHRSQRARAFRRGSAPLLLAGSRRMAERPAGRELTPGRSPAAAAPAVATPVAAAVRVGEPAEPRWRPPSPRGASRRRGAPELGA